MSGHHPTSGMVMSPIVATLARHGIPGQMENSYLGGPQFNAISPAQFYGGGDRGSPMVTRGMGAISYPSSTRQLLLSPRTPIIRRRRLHPVHMFLGVDEAGRSPVLGQALVYGIPYCPATYEEKLDELGFAGAMDFL